MIITDKTIIEHYNLNKNSKHIYWNKFKKYLINRFEDTNSISEAAYRICFNIIETPKCCICGSPVIFTKFNKGYKETCNSKKCISTNRLNKIKKTNLLKYGVKYTTQTDSMKNASKKTKLLRYGDAYWSNPQKTSESLNNRTQEQWNETYKKRASTLYDKYGEDVINVFQVSIIKNKIKETNLLKYGVENPINNLDIKEKIKQTCLLKYGVECYQQSTQFKEQLAYNFSTGIPQNKRKETCLKKYGVENVMLVEEFKDKKINSELKNMTFNCSKQEDYIYNLLLTKFSKINRQYKSKEYPFACDFYIPELNLYIECNFSQYHNGKQYLGNENDLQEIENFKKRSNEIKEKTGKNKTQYDNIIYTWSDLDVRKRNIAKENNLNYLEFFNIKEFNKWFEAQ